MRLDAGRGRQRIEPLLLEEGSTPRVEDVVVAVDVAQVTTGAHDVAPRGALALQQAGDVVEGAPQLRRKIADVDADSVLVDRRRARDKQDADPSDIDSHAARKRAGLGVGVSLV